MGLWLVRPWPWQGVADAAATDADAAGAPEPTKAQTTTTVELPAEHPYYNAIDKSTRRFRSEKEINLSEARRRARYRSHDPRRWRARLFGDAFGATSSAGTSDDDEPDTPDPVAIDYPLYDWSTAEHAMCKIEDEKGVTIQRPPLGYSDESARRLAQEAGCEWYFSIADFDEALLNGTIAIKHTGGLPSMHVELSMTPSTPPAKPATEPSKPTLEKKQSPSGVMDLVETLR